MAPKPKGHMGNPPATMSSNIEPTIFNLFNDFNHINEEKQTNGIVQLVKHFTKESNSVRDKDGNLSSEISYTIKRLIRGLGSPKPEVLKSYFTALSCLLSSLPDLTCEDVKLCVDKELSNSSGSISTEKKEVLIARTLAWGAVMRSGLLTNASPDQQKAVFNDLLTCSKKKSYLPLAAYSFLIDIIPRLESTTFQNVVWPGLKEELMKPWESQTLDSLLLLLVCQKHHGKIIKAKHLKQSLGSEDILTEDTLKHFAQRLLFSTYLKHPLYQVFCEHLSKPEEAHLLQQFWCKEIPKLLSAVKNKDLATLELFTNMVESVGPNDQITLILSDQIISFLNHTLSESYKRLSPEIRDRAHKAVASLGNVLTNPEAPDGVRLSVVKALLFKSSSLEFEKTSQNLEKSTHVITILVGLLESDSAKALAEMLKNALCSGPQKSKKDVMFAVQQFSRLVYHSNIEDMSWRVNQLKFLISQSFFKSKNSALTDDVCSTLKHSFFKALGTKLPSVENLLQVLNTLVNHVKELLDAGAVPRLPLSTESLDAWKKTLSLVKKMKESKPGSVQQIFHLLFLYMALYLFMDAAMALDALKELHSCYEHSLSSSNKKRKSLKTDDEPHWIEVTVELLLSLLSHGSNLLRTVVGIVFTHLRKHITPAALQQILDVLHPDESENALAVVDDANGAQSEADDEESSDDDSNEDDGSDDNSSDVSSIEDDENSDLEDKSLDEEETINDQLRSEIRDVLGNCASDNESVDMDEADEEELRRVDEALVKAFQSAQTKRRTQKGKKNKKQSKVDELLMHFRLRVLDLIDIFLTKTPPLSLILPMIQPLFSLLEVSSKDVHLKSLASRIRSLLHKISSVKKFPSLDGVTSSDIAELLTALINKGNRTAAMFLETVDIVTDCCTMLVRCSEHLPKTEQGEIVSICKEALKSFLKKRDCLLPIGLFRSIVTLHWEGCWELADVLVQGAFDSELRPIRRTHSVELLGAVFKNARLMKSETASERRHREIITSTLISNAVKFFASNGTSLHPQQKYVIGLYQALHLCLSQQRDSLKESSELLNALSKFSDENPPHGEAKKRFNELHRVLACKRNETENSPKNILSFHSKDRMKTTETGLNDCSNDTSNVASSNGAINVRVHNVSPKKKKKAHLTQGNGNSHEAADLDKKKRNDCQTSNNGFGKNVPNAKRGCILDCSKETIPLKKIKTVKANGVSEDEIQSGPLKSDGSVKRKKKKMLTV